MMPHPLYPENATYAPHDWAILAAYWHPVALSEEVTDDGPWGGTLLDVPLVLYRIDGQLTVALDRCPHRGTRLSLGRMHEGRLVCPYHGLEFNGEGACVAVPAHGDDRPARYLNIPVMRAEERYGLIWVCLTGEPAAPLPDWSAIEAPDNQRVILHDIWETSAGRHFENFCDLAHFSFAHADTFGAADSPEVRPYAVERTEVGFHYDVGVEMLDSGVFGEGVITQIRSEYHVSLPFATRLTLHFSKGLEHICDVASPLSAGRTRIFILKSRDHDQQESLEEWLRFQHAVNEEDRVMVESQYPVGLPLTGMEEKHLASDRFSVLYRQYWTDLGMTGPI
jgi:vanillate O-demethylase monooxygenase subunit